MKTKLVRFKADYFDNGTVKWAAGAHYPVSEDTLRQVALGVAETVEIDTSLEKAEQLAKKAQIAFDKAAAASAEAERLVEAARAAQQLADDAAAAAAAAAEAPAEPAAVAEAPVVEEKAEEVAAEVPVEAPAEAPAEAPVENNEPQA